MARLRTILAPALIALAAIPLAGNAQGGGRGFLFNDPRTSLTFRTGWAFANAGSDLFAFTTDQLTLNRSDFNALSLGVDWATRVLPRTSVVLSFSYANASKLSEFRNFVDNNQLPIEQTTSFKRVPVTIGIRQYLVPVGRSVGRYAWIPSRLAPYVGAGAGFMYYRFHQEGDWIDFQSPTMDVFPAQFDSEGWTGTAHLLAGLDYSLGPRLALTAEARYLWSKAPLSRDFSGFQRLDLSGLATTAGLTVRF